MAIRTETGPLVALVDWGGVLTTSMDQNTAKWALAEGIALEHFFEVLHEWSLLGATSPAVRFETGLIGTASFEEELAIALCSKGSQVVSTHGLLGRMIGDLPANEAVFDLLADWHADGMRLAVLSNSWGLEHYRRDQWGIFEDAFLSAEVGLRKPDPAIFHLAADRMGVAVQQCLFIDDMAHNVESAARVGMSAHLFVDADQLARDVAGLA